MKIKEAILVLQKMNPDDEVYLDFPKEFLPKNSNEAKSYLDGNYETQAERFGY